MKNDCIGELLFTLKMPLNSDPNVKHEFVATAEHIATLLPNVVPPDEDSIIIDGEPIGNPLIITKTDDVFYCYYGIQRRYLSTNIELEYALGEIWIKLNLDGVL